MNYGLRGKVAIISGGSHGIGKNISLKLYEEGCNICIFSRDEDRIKNVINKLNKNRVIGIKANALNKNDINKVINEVILKWNSIDIIINNVGGGGRWGKRIFENTSDDVWEDVYNKNTTVARVLTMKAIPYMRKKKWGRVVTISSILGKEGGGRPWFNMAKSSQISLMKTLAMTPYLVQDGLTFNTIAPGHISVNDEVCKKMNSIIKKCPLGRLGTTEEVASVVLFVCSKQASLLNGSCIVVDGGESHSF